MLVREAMSKDVEWIAPDTPLQEAALKMRDLDVGSLPVGAKDKVIGMITDRDIACRGVAVGCDPASTLVAEIMTKKVTWCYDDQDVTEAAQLMEKEQLHRLPVMNREKRMTGMLSLGDLALHAPHELSGEVVEAVSRHAN